MKVRKPEHSPSNAAAISKIGPPSRPITLAPVQRRLLSLSIVALVGAGCSTTSVPTASFATVATHSVHYARPVSHSAAAPAVNDYVTYHNGPVLVTPKLYLIFWGYQKYGDPDNVEKLLTAYARDIGGSGHDNIETQYYQVVSSQKTYIANSKQQFGGAWNDNSAVPKNPTDQQIAAEALKSIAHLRYDPSGLYVVATPHAHSEVGFGPHWCAYHSYTYYDTSKLLTYANLPYMPDAGKQCGADFIKPPAGETAIDEGVTIMAGHEFGEAVTDPVPFSGWNGVSGEIGDTCAWHNIANIKFGSKAYTTQPMLSDATESCVQTYK